MMAYGTFICFKYDRVIFIPIGGHRNKDSIQSIPGVSYTVNTPEQTASGQSRLLVLTNIADRVARENNHCVCVLVITKWLANNGGNMGGVPI